jgi:succinoglycan biosynthesis transport protein ExoP
MEWPSESGGDAAQSGAAIDLKRAILGHKLLLFVCVAVGAGLGYLQYTKSPLVFESSARIRLIQNQTLQGVEGLQEFTGQPDPLDTQAVLIKSPIVLERAATDLLAQNLPSMGGHPMGSIMAGLTVTRSSDSEEILELSFRGSDRFDCQKVLSAVIAAYEVYLSDSQSQSADYALGLINEAKDELMRDLKQMEDDYAQFRNRAELLWAGGNALNIHSERLAGIEAARSALLLEQTRLESQRKSIRALLDRGEDREAILLMIDQTAAPAGTTAEGESPVSIALQLMPLVLEEQLLLEELGEKHPKVQMLQKRIALMRQFLESGGIQTPEDPASSARPDIVTTYLNSLKLQMEANDVTIASLNEHFKTEEVSGKLLSSDENENRVRLEEIGRTKALYDEILNDLQAWELTKDTGHMAAESIISPGPGYQVAPDFAKSLSLGCVLGLLAGLAISVLIEMSDRSYQNPTDIQRHLGAPVIGHIPSIDIGRERKLTGDEKVDSSLVAYHRPGSGIAESYRNIRTALLMGTPHRVIQVTSANPGDGKTTLSSNLAVAIARSGKRCLLLDCDFRRPRVHELFGLTNSIGTSDIINNGADPSDVIQPGPLDTLDILTTGPRVDNPAELLLTPRFSELLALVRERYDIVVVDTPPVLAVSDPSAVATMTDGTILVLRMSRYARPLAGRVKETLGLVGGKLLGVVVNGTGDHGGYGYGYGRYSYNAPGQYYHEAGEWSYQDGRAPDRKYLDESRVRAKDPIASVE